MKVWCWQYCSTTLCSAQSHTKGPKQINVVNPCLHHQPGSNTVQNKMQSRNAQPCQRSHTTQALQNAKKGLAGRPKEELSSVFPSETRTYQPWIYHCTFFPNITYFCLIQSDLISSKNTPWPAAPPGCVLCRGSTMKGGGHHAAMDSPVQELCSAPTTDLRIVLIVHPFH